MRNSLLLAFLLMFGLVFGAACGGGSQGRTGQTQPSTSGGSELLVINSSAEPIFYIYMSPSAQTTWGPDLLGSEVLMIGQTFTITGLTPGAWDIRVVDQSGNYKEFYNQRIGAGQVYTLEVTSTGWTRGR